MKSKAITTATVALLLVMALIGLNLNMAPAVLGAPAAAPTPVSVTRPAGEGYVTFTPFNAAVVTADTTASCADVGPYSVADVLYSIDQGTTNTTTLTAKWSIDGSTLATGVNVVAANAADATDMTQLQVFGKYLCVLADVANSNPITITVQVLAK